MDARLIVVGGKADRRALKLKLPTVIGRSREADLTVPHPMISRQHCKLYEVDGLLMVRDLDSLNGVFLGDQRISESPLLPDDEFTVGPLTFRAAYAYQGDLDAVPAPKTVEPEAPEPEKPQAPAAGVADETPFDPTFAAAGGIEQPTDFLFLQQQDTGSPGEEVLDFSTWGDDRPQQGSAEAVEEVDEIEIVEIEEDEEEEPEPTPPPPLIDTQPIAEETPDAEAWEAVQTAAAEDMVRGRRPKPPPKKRRWALGGGKQKDEPESAASQPAASTPAKETPAPPSSPAKKQRTTLPKPKSQPDETPNSPAATDPGSDQSAPAKSEDEELNKFLKGLQ